MSSSQSTQISAILLLLGNGCARVPFCEYYPDRCVADESGDTSASGSGGTAATESDGVGSESQSESDSQTNGDSGTLDEGTLPDTPDAPSITPEAIKRFELEWAPATGADSFRLDLRPPDQLDWVPIAEDVSETFFTSLAALHLSSGASYRIAACNIYGCVESAPVDVENESLTAAIGYIKASNPGMADAFGSRVAISDDASTLVVAATGEASADGMQNDDQAPGAGAVYVFVRENLEWSFQAYVKPLNPDSGDQFGYDISLSGDASTLAVGSPEEDSASTVINVGELNDFALSSGCAYIFSRDNTSWIQQAYIKAPNSEADDRFGTSVSVSANGNRLIVGAEGESGGGVGVGANPSDNSASEAGAVYVFERAGGDWTFGRYIKPQNTDAGDHFGLSVRMAADGETFVVGAPGESSSSPDLPENDDSSASGAVYVFTYFNGDWVQEEYVKAEGISPGDQFGASVAISGSATIAIGAIGEDGSGQGIDPEVDDFTPASGAVYTLDYDGIGWGNQRYIKSQNPHVGDEFGQSVALSSNGAVLAVGATGDASSGVGINSTEVTDAVYSGATYTFGALGDSWSPRSYVKALNTQSGDLFGLSVALSSDGGTLVVGAAGEDGSGSGLSGVPLSNTSSNSGATYLY